MASQHSPQSDLEWLAFQYAAGELCGAELVAFEQRLANDLAACEALATAVVLCQTVAACEQQVAVPLLRSKNRSRRQLVCWPGLALLSSAACLAVMINWTEVGRTGPRGSHASKGAPSVATLWIEGAEQAAESNLDVNGATEIAPDSNVELAAANVEGNQSLVDDTETAHAINFSDLKTVELEVDDDAVPGWMLAAVAERQRGMGDSEMEVIQD